MHDHEDSIDLEHAIAHLERGFERLPPADVSIDRDILRAALASAAERLHDNYPYQHPLYVGQMLKPPHPVARLAYALAMELNPNNHALDGGRASSAMEKEAVAEIAGMFGWDTHLGHLTGGGTMANLEALWVAREVTGGKSIAASEQAHYTHARLSGVIGADFHAVPTGPRGRMDTHALKELVVRDDVGTVVATLGTSGAGSMDPLHEILALREHYGFRLHIDAAYGGYFALAGNLGEDARRAFDLVHEADSIVIDPHKHGLQPYGCGCVLFRDPDVGRVYQHDSPYTYFSSPELHLGEISLECSRPGAAAVALWTTMRMLPLVCGGEFARGLESGREASVALYDALRDDPRVAPLFPPDLDIVVWAMRAERASESSEHARNVFNAAAQNDLHLALARFPRRMIERTGAVSKWDADDVTCLRSCAMKPQHLAWMPEIIKRLRASM